MKKILVLSVFILFAFAQAHGQTSGGTPPSFNGGGMALAPARFELEMQPGTETTVVVNLEYRSTNGTDQPARIVASLNDWSITRDGRVEYFRANTLANSASSWLIYSPAEAAVAPGTTHQIRVTISVPADAAPGDHLTALIIEQRADTIKFNQNARQMIVRYRLASVFYIKVSKLTKVGSFENLLAENTDKGIVITPTLKNSGNSVVRPTASLKIVDAQGKIVADMPEIEPLPLLAGSQTSQPVVIENTLLPGVYSVKYRVDFQDGNRATEGIIELVVKNTRRIAALEKPAKP